MRGVAVNDNTRLATRLFGTGNVLVLHRFTLDLVGGDHLAALFLEQLLYWTERSRNEDGWVVKTYAQWEAEIGMSRKVIVRVADTLKPLGVETAVRRSPFHRMQPVVHYRVNLDVLGGAIRATLETAQRAISESDVSALSDVAQTAVSITETTTETTKEEDTPRPPAYEPPAIHVLNVDTVAQMNGAQLVQAYAEVMGLSGEAIWYAGRKVAAALVKEGVTPDDVRAFLNELRAQPDRFNGYRFNYMAEDLPSWKRRRGERPAAPVAVVETPAQRKAREAQEAAERLEWQRAQGVLP